MDVSEKNKNFFVENVRKNRIDRLQEKEKEQKRQYAALIIQRNYRGYKARKNFHNTIL